MSKSRQRQRAKRRARQEAQTLGRATIARLCKLCDRALPYRSHQQHCAYCRAIRAGASVQREIGAFHYQRTVAQAAKRVSRVVPMISTWYEINVRGSAHA